jgi:dihydroneopterin aldolase
MSTLLQTISLVDARFHAYHGFYPEEQILGNSFLVTIRVSWHPQSIHMEDLSKTVNYEDLYSLAKKEMKTPRKLLETVALALLEELKQLFPYLENIEVAIQKNHPPFGGDVSQTMVQFQWKKEKKVEFR